MRLWWLIISGYFLLLSCGGGYRAPGALREAGPSRVPVDLVFEREISGRVLAYELRDPSGLAVDARGNLYITDTGNHRLLKLDRDLKPVREYGGYGSGAGRFINPADLIIDRGLNLYVLDAGNHRVIHLDANFNYIDEIIPEEDSQVIISNMGLLSGLQISPLGELTVADFDNSRLIRMDNFNRFSRYVGDFAYGSGALLNPTGIAADEAGQLYVADGGNGRLAVYDDYGNFIHQIGKGDLEQPSAVAISPDGIIWAADKTSQAVFAFAGDGRRLYRDGGRHIDEFTFSDIEAIAVSPDGRLYVADSGNNRVMVYRIVYDGNR